MTTPTLPTHLGGYQHLEPDVITKPDDILVQDGIPQAFCTGYSGKVEDVEGSSQCRVYRLMPVAKQADSHLRDVAAGRITGAAAPSATLPSEAARRKGIPLYSGLLAYFPDALCAVAELSRIGNDQHNPGKPLHWDRSKSGDEADALMRHLLQCDEVDKDGVAHAVKVAWRGLALAQKKLEASRGRP